MRIVKKSLLNMIDFFEDNDSKNSKIMANTIIKNDLLQNYQNNLNF